MAQAGSRTLLVDANFREPAQQKIYDVEGETGLSEVLSGRTTLDCAISRTPIEGLEVLPCGALPRNPSEMLNGPSFSKLIENAVSPLPVHPAGLATGAVGDGRAHPRGDGGRDVVRPCAPAPPAAAPVTRDSTAC